MERTWPACSAAGKVIGVAAYSFSPGLGAAVFFAPDLWLLYQLLQPSAQALGPVYTRFIPAGNEVWLTIDDGPDERDTPLILDQLDRHRAKATFFVIGEKARKFPELIREVVRRGHEIGHHTEHHPCFNFWAASRRRVRAELDGGLEALAGAGVCPRFFRPPVGIKNLYLPRALAERGLACVGWSVRGLDCHTADPRRVAARVLGRLRPGNIILLHEGPAVAGPVRVAAITEVLQGLGDRGFSAILPGSSRLRTPGRETDKMA